MVLEDFKREGICRSQGKSAENLFNRSPYMNGPKYGEKLELENSSEQHGDTIQGPIVVMNEVHSLVDNIMIFTLETST